MNGDSDWMEFVPGRENMLATAAFSPKILSLCVAETWKIFANGQFAGRFNHLFRYE